MAETVIHMIRTVQRSTNFLEATRLTLCGRTVPYEKTQAGENTRMCKSCQNLRSIHFIRDYRRM